MEEFKENASPVSEKYAQFISKAVMRMEELITGLLDYSRLSRVKQAQVVSLQTILEDVRLDLNSLIERNSVRLGIGEMPTIVAYPLELKLLFQNLISNAIKFTRPNTKPEIDISAQKIENGWLFRVSDNGIGISESDYVKIFDLFQRLHSKADFDGTGIGLAQCKKIAEIHNGKIWVESKEGVGSDFYFTIQLKAYEN
jgi:light-regulated signal transduction histidine kinase (bacteriophytochrome)